MGTSASNIDNIDRAARKQIRKSRNLLHLLDAIGYKYDDD